MRREEGGAKIFGVFRVKNHDFTPKNLIFSNFRIRPWTIPCQFFSNVIMYNIYFYYFNLQFLNYVMFISTKILLSHTYLTLDDFGSPVYAHYFFWSQSHLNNLAFQSFDWSYLMKKSLKISEEQAKGYSSEWVIVA